MNVRPSLLFYCQHAPGLGHLVRSWALAAELAHDFDVVVLSGAAQPGGLPPPRGVRTIALPPVGESSVPPTAGGSLRAVDAVLASLRRNLILDAFRRLQPQVIVIELFPFGRKKSAAELLPLLEEAAANANPRPMVLCSLRDIVVSRGEDQEEHDERARRLTDRYFHGILVHGDPSLARLEESFRPRKPVRVPVHYTGYVTGGAVPVPAVGARRPEILLSAGGGRVGEQLMRHAVKAYELLRARERFDMRIVAGPFCPDDVWRDLSLAGSRDGGLRLLKSVPDLRAELSNAAVSVSQCGYNTAFDIVSTGTPALVVPFGDGEEDEQRTRAGRLEQLGVLRVLAAERLTPATLASEIVETSRFRPRPAALKLDGARATRRLVGELLQSHLADPVSRAVAAPR